MNFVPEFLKRMGRRLHDMFDETATRKAYDETFCAERGIPLPEDEDTHYPGSD